MCTHLKDGGLDADLFLENGEQEVGWLRQRLCFVAKGSLQQAEAGSGKQAVTQRRTSMTADWMPTFFWRKVNRKSASSWGAPLASLLSTSFSFHTSFISFSVSRLLMCRLRTCRTQGFPSEQNRQTGTSAATFGLAVICQLVCNTSSSPALLQGHSTERLLLAFLVCEALRCAGRSSKGQTFAAAGKQVCSDS